MATTMVTLKTGEEIEVPLTVDQVTEAIQNATGIWVKLTNEAGEGATVPAGNITSVRSWN